MASEAGLNSSLRGFFLQLHRAELAATGSDRRAAFRRTRAAIGAAIAVGIPAGALAECLGVTVASIRNRAAHTGGTITAEEVRQFTPLSLTAINKLTSPELRKVNEDPEPHYRISDVVNALMVLPD